MSTEPAPATNPGTVVVVDVGVRWGAAEAWRALEPHVRVFGFDPDPEECARLNATSLERGDLGTTYVPMALGARAETVKLFVTRQPACSSTYAPLTDLVRSIPVLADIEVTDEVLVDVLPLDQWCTDNGVTHVDVLKVDTQGSELGVLQGGVTALSTCALVECEVEFNPIYDGQPLFADVDEFLRGQGFVLWKLDNLMHYTDGDVLPRLDVALTVSSDARTSPARIGGGQLYWADAFWVRKALIHPSEPLPPDTARRAALIAEAAGLPDLAVRIFPDSAAGLLAAARRARRQRRRQRVASSTVTLNDADDRSPPTPSRRAARILRRASSVLARRR